MDTLRYRGTIGRLGASKRFGYILPESIMDATTGQSAPTTDDVFIHQDSCPITIYAGLQVEFEQIPDPTRDGAFRAYMVKIPLQGSTTDPTDEAVVTPQGVLAALVNATPDELARIIRAINRDYVPRKESVNQLFGRWLKEVIFILLIVTCVPPLLHGLYDGFWAVLRTIFA